MFDDQTVELLPARTVMTSLRPPGSKNVGHGAMNAGRGSVRQLNLTFIVQVGDNNTAVVQQINQAGGFSRAGQIATVSIGR
jgi:hypothetical protein